MALSRVGYFSRETVVSLSRNFMMSVACVITIAISLALVGGALVYTNWVDNGTARWQGNVAFDVFMNVDATESQIADVRQALENDSDVKKASFLDKQAAYNEFKSLFSKEPALVENVDAASLPTSFKVTLVNAKTIDTVTKRYATRPGVWSIASPSQAVKDEITRAERTRLVLLSLSALLLVSSVILVIFTVRLATLARRREIEVMKLVGASNWFVRIPFMAEGGVQGLLGALFAALLTVVVAKLIPAFAQPPKGPGGVSTYFIDPSYVAWTVGGLFLSGITIGVVAAFIGLYRYLDV
ncbi:MAG: cell division protein FtsX [Acidimicrobiia bacterium]